MANRVTVPGITLTYLNDGIERFDTPAEDAINMIRRLNDNMQHTPYGAAAKLTFEVANVQITPVQLRVVDLLEHAISLAQIARDGLTEEKKAELQELMRIAALIRERMQLSEVYSTEEERVALWPILPLSPNNIPRRIDACINVSFRELMTTETIFHMLVEYTIANFHAQLVNPRYCILGGTDDGNEGYVKIRVRADCYVQTEAQAADSLRVYEEATREPEEEPEDDDNDDDDDDDDDDDNT